MNIKPLILRIFQSKLLLVLLVAASFPALAQEGKLLIYGTVVSADSTLLVPNTYVINKRTLAGTVTNGQGEFLIHGDVNDTLVFSNVSYQFYYYRITGSEPNNLVIKLKTRNYLLDEVSVSAYRIRSNDPKPMSMGKPMIPRNSEIRTSEPLAPTLANPVDFLYYMFARHPKQLEKLRQLYAEDYYKRKLQEGNNREILVQLTGLPKEELDAFMFYCKYSDTQVRTVNDYVFLQSLLQCYDQFEREKTLNKLLEEQEVQEKTQGERFKD